MGWAHWWMGRAHWWMGRPLAGWVCETSLASHSWMGRPIDEWAVLTYGSEQWPCSPKEHGHSKTKYFTCVPELKQYPPRLTTISTTHPPQHNLTPLPQDQHLQNKKNSLQTTKMCVNTVVNCVVCTRQISSGVTRCGFSGCAGIPKVTQQSICYRCSPSGRWTGGFVLPCEF